MTHLTNRGSERLVAVIESEGLVGVYCCGCTVLPPLSFFLIEGATVGFERGGSFANGVSPEASIFGKCRPLKMGDVASNEGLFE